MDEIKNMFDGIKPYNEPNFTWEQEYGCAFVDNTPSELYDLAAEYHRRSEAYDRCVCTGEIRHGGIMPTNNHEFRLITKRAKELLKELVVIANRHGFSEKELRIEISKFDRCH
jgi:hypothetical protein